MAKGAVEPLACGEVLMSVMVSFTSAPETPKHFTLNLSGIPLPSNDDARYGQVHGSA